MHDATSRGIADMARVQRGWISKARQGKRNQGRSRALSPSMQRSFCRPMPGKSGVDLRAVAPLACRVAVMRSNRDAIRVISPGAELVTEGHKTQLSPATCSASGRFSATSSKPALINSKPDTIPQSSKSAVMIEASTMKNGRQDRADAGSWRNAKPTGIP